MRRLLSLVSFPVFLLVCATGAWADTCNRHADNLVTNCGFENGSFSGWTGTATTASPNYAGVDTGDPFTIAPTPYEGMYEAYLGNPGSTFALTQALSTTSGVTYLLQFALLNDTTPASPYTNSFAVLFGGNSIFSQTGVAAGAYTLYSVYGTASSASTALSFVSRNDGGYFELDSVSVSAATPEPSSWLLVGTGILGCFATGWRRLALPLAS